MSLVGEEVDDGRSQNMMEEYVSASDGYETGGRGMHNSKESKSIVSS